MAYSRVKSNYSKRIRLEFFVLPVEEYKKQQKNGDITEDDLRGLEKDVQTLTDNSIKEVDKIAADKEKEFPRSHKLYVNQQF